MLLKIFLTMTITFSVSAKKIDILFMGDSLTEGYGVSKKESYPELVMNKLLKKYPQVTFLNGSISGSTSASAMSRLKWFSKVSPKIVILALGGNDGLRGVPVKETKKNLSEAIRFAKSKGSHVVLAGMMAPPNYGKKYAKDFSSQYAELSKKHSVSLIPFLLEGVAGEKKYNQNDGIHPNASGHKLMMDLVYPFVKKAYENATKSQ